MRIVIAIESLAGGGAEGVVHRLAAGLARRGHRVYVYCLRDAGRPLDKLLDAGVTVRQAHSFGRDVRLALRVAAWLRRDRPDVLHAHSCAALVWTFPAARLLGIPLLHVWHGWPVGPRTREHRGAELLDRFIARVGANSRAVQARLPRSRNSAAAAYLPNGLDLEPEPPAVARRRLEEHCGCRFDGPVILNVGNMRVEKDLPTLLRAFAQMTSQQPAAQLVCIGHRHDRECCLETERLCRRLRLANRVHFPGPRVEAWELLAGADVLCLSSRSESMPNVILEAMSQRVPIVATAVGDVGTLMPSARPRTHLLRHHETALLVPPGQPTALAEALVLSLRHRDEARRRTLRALEDYRRRFRVAQMVARYESVYERCRCGESTPPRRRPSVLLVGPAPPQIGGLVTSIQLLLSSPLRARFRLRSFATTVGARDASVTRPGWRRILRAAASLVRHVAALARLAGVIARRRVDLVHIFTCSYFTFYRSLLDLVVAKALGCRVILHIKGGRFEDFCLYAGAWGQRVIRAGFELADGALVLSPRWIPALRPFTGSAPVWVLPNAVADPVRYAEPGTQRPCQFVYMAALTRAKGLEDLLDAAAVLHAGGHDFRLRIAGPAPAEPVACWQQRVAELGLAGVVEFHGPVSGAEKDLLLAGGDAFVHPSHSEALPNAVLEAGAAGLPIVATAVGNVPEMLACDTGEVPALLVPPRDPSRLACALERLVTDPGLRARLGEEARQRVLTRYRLAGVAGQLGVIYSEVLRTAPDVAAKTPESGSAVTRNVPEAGPVPRKWAEPRETRSR